MLALHPPSMDLNAVLIKELRQELRVRGFVWSFIGFHIAMIIFTLGSFATQRQWHDWDFIASTPWFWTMLAIPLFIAVPMRGFTAFRKEANAKELELIFLTHTSSWQIVLYKWFALCLQGVLLLTAALPYVIVRYVIGSLDLREAFVSIGLLLLTTMLLTALTLLISAQNMNRPRFSVFRVIIVLVFGLPAANYVIMFAAYGLSRLSPFSAMSGVDIPVTLLVSAMLMLLLLLEFAASHIAARAENHAYIKRLLGVLALAIGVIFYAADIGNPEFIYHGVRLYLLLICISALCEDPVYVQSIYAPYVWGGAWKRRLGIWLYPGWPSGIVYTISMCVLFYTVMDWVGTPQFSRVFSGFAVAAGLCLPLIVTQTLWPRLRNKWWPYLMVQAMLWLFSFMVVQSAPRHACSTLHDTDYLVSLLPISVLTHYLAPRQFCPVYSVMALSSIGIFLLLALPWWRTWRQVRDTEQLTRTALEAHQQHV